jgi:hypothetical protein
MKSLIDQKVEIVQVPRERIVDESLYEFLHGKLFLMFHDMPKSTSYLPPRVRLDTNF